MPLKATSIVASELIPKNTLRKSLLLLNEDGTDSVYIKRERSEATTVSATDHDHRIGPGASFSLNSMLDGKEWIQGRYTAIASANTPTIAIFETEDITR
jgi:hypothetical protein